MNNNTTIKNIGISALDIPLQDVHLIEASAGTGKTWTLAALVVRLLLESKRPCEQIIATTFTRAAAAEMRQRIRERIDQTKRLIEKILLVMPILDNFLSGTNLNDMALSEYTNGELVSSLDDSQTTSIATITYNIVTDIKTKLTTDTQALELLKDPLNDYIISFLIQEQLEQLVNIRQAQQNQEQQSSNHSTIQPSGKVGLNWARKHLELTLIQLDRMFVSTLDSLCQKLLREFAFDLLLQQGQGKPLELTADNDGTTDELIHDAIRIWRQQQNSKTPQLMTLLAETNKLSDTGELFRQVNRAMNFIAEPLLPAPTISVDLAKITSLINQLIKIDDTPLAGFFDSDGEYYKKLWKKRGLYNTGKLWHSLKHKLITHQGATPSYLTEKEQTLLINFADKLDNNFSKNNKDAQEVFSHLAVVKLMLKINEELAKISQQIDALTEHRNYFVCHYVREQLPQVLENQGKTTFALQLRQLNIALQQDALKKNASDKEAKRLAKQIRHRYPVALIDEFQDVNADQAGMLYQIYQDQVTANESKKGCLLLVGDPKQSIYGFRGGDIHNYQRIKRTIPETHHHTLDTNRRSQEKLIESLNSLFTAKNDFLEKVAYKPVQAFGINDTLLDANNQPIAGLLRHIAVDAQGIDTVNDAEDLNRVDNTNNKIQACNKKTDSKQTSNKKIKASTAEVLAQKIAELLATHSIKDCSLKDNETGSTRSLTADDVAVLFKSRFDVVGLEKQLHKRGIATFKGADESVFSGQMATDMACIMQAMLQPQHIATVRRALITLAFGYNQAELDALMDDQAVKPQHWHAELRAYHFADLQFAFSEAGKAWQAFGFLAGWQKLAEQFAIWQRLADHSSASDEAERLLIDARHVLEIIQTQAINAKATQGNAGTATSSSNQSDTPLHETILLTWFREQLTAQPKEDWALQRRLPSANGVQIMSIHKSKGLEFPVVFVVGVDNTTKQAKKLADIFLTIDDNNRITLTAQSGKDDVNIHADNARRHAEDIRVTYVAFTRPSQLLYVVTQDSLENAVIKTNSKGKQTGTKENALAHWLLDNSKFQKEVADTFEADKVDLTTDFSQQIKQQATEPNPSNSDIATKALQPTFNAESTPKPKPKPSKTHFKTWRATSFSALARDLHHDTANSGSATAQQHGITETQVQQSPDYVMEAIFEENENALDEAVASVVIDEVNIENNDTVDTVSPDPIRFNFPRGASAGSFLHKVFEKLDFTHSDNWQWMIASIAEQFGIAQEFTRYGHEFDETNQSAVQTWLQEVLHTPLSSGVCLADIPAKQRLPEMGFNLGLGKEFSTHKLSEHLQQTGFDIQLPTQTKLFRFLKGEIDLVYEHAGKYYVLDYKSNHLGDQLADYQTPQLQHAMNHAGYWLQAAIYMLALHRYLRVRLPDYDPAQHLGGVEYAFIRGMYPDSLQKNSVQKNSLQTSSLKTSIDDKDTATGVISWYPSVDFIEELDAVFG